MNFTTVVPIMLLYLQTSIWSQASSNIRPINWCEVICKPEQTAVYYINGIFSPFSVSLDAAWEMRRKLGGLPQFNKDSLWGLAYNTTDQLRDLVEAYDQQTNEHRLQEYLTSKLELSRLLIDSESQRPEQSQKILSQLNALEHQHFGELNGKLNSDTVKNWRAHTRAFQKLILRGHRVLLISHSQGNFFANTAFSALRQRYPKIPAYALANIQLATPSERVLSGGPYLTRTDDQVINWVRKLSRLRGIEVLAANFMPQATEFGLHHDFLQSYLNDGDIYTTIKSEIADELAQLRPDAVFNNSASMDDATPAVQVLGQQTTGSDMQILLRSPRGDIDFYPVSNGSQVRHLSRKSCSELEDGIYSIGLEVADTGPVTRYLIEGRAGVSYLQSLAKIQNQKRHWAFGFEIKSIYETYRKQTLFRGFEVRRHRHDQQSLDSLVDLSREIHADFEGHDQCFEEALQP